MITSFTSLPFDISHAIAEALDIRSFVNLSRTNRHFHQLLQDEATARRCLKKNIPYSPSAQARSASDGTSYRNALSQNYDHSEALRTGTPYSASILAWATNFCYNQGVLIHSNDHEVRIIDVHNAASLERVITRQAFARQLHKNPDDTAASGDSNDRLSIVGYSEGVAIVLYEGDLVTGSWLFAVDVRVTRSSQSQEFQTRFILRHRLTSAKKLFVRHNASFLYFGTYSGQGLQGHHEWLIQGIDLTNGRPVSKKPLQLVGFVGAEIGSTAAFAIHNGCFYAVSNQSSHESEEIDWTSYYSCVCFPLVEANPDVRIRTIYRRQHREGPINDAFTNISLQMDQHNNELLIVECRKEWLRGGSTNVRTYYTEQFKLAEHEDLDPQPTYPPNDPLARTIDLCNNSRYEEERIRIGRKFHRDYTGDPKCDFIRAKTKFDAYNSAAHSFVDLVIDSVAVPGSFRPRERLSLRVASRIPKSPLERDPILLGKFIVRPTELDKDGEAIEGSEEEFQPTEVHLWPPSNAPAELLDILCPNGRAGNVNAVLDDRSIVYMAGPPQANSRGERAIVMISFDPTWGFEGMKRWNEYVEDSGVRSAVNPTGEQVEEKPKSPVSARLKRKGADISSPAVAGDLDMPDWSSPVDGEPAAKRQKIHVPAASEIRTSAGPSGSVASSRPRHMWREEEATYLSIKRGFWLR